MKLAVSNNIYQAIFAEQPDPSITDLRAAWEMNKMFQGPHELRILQEACLRVREAYGGECRVVL